MFPMVPFYNLPKLHEMIKDQCPVTYSSLWTTYQEIIPAVRRQVSDPSCFVLRALPEEDRPLNVANDSGRHLAAILGPRSLNPLHDGQWIGSSDG